MVEMDTVQPSRPVPHPARPTWRRRLRQTLAVGALVAATAGLLLLAADQWVRAATRKFVYREVSQVPERPVGIVFGALVVGDRLSPVLRARVQAGVDLYHAGKVRKLLMTGDNGRPDYDEVTAMKKYAVEHGVPARDVVRDFAGFRTFDSCYRARDVFQVNGAILVTQAFHLPRAVFTARKLGVDAVGYVAPDNVPEPIVRGWTRRELFARTTAVLDLYVFHRQPRFLGHREPLFQNETEER